MCTQTLAASILSGVLAGFLSAQEIRPEIKGTILEPGINQPIADVEISLFALPERLPDKPVIMRPTTTEPLQKVKTDPHGGFSLKTGKLGEYSLQLKKPGYGQTQTVLRQLIAGPEGSSTTLMLDKDHPVREVVYYLARPGEVTGQLVDEETGKPLAGLPVWVQSVGWQWGLRRTGPGGSDKTDAEGRFTVKNLVPGDYVALTPGAGTAKALPEPDPAWSREDYPRTYFPGVHDEDGAMLVNVPSAGAVNLGQLRLRKAPRYHASVHLSAAGCEQAQKVSLVLMTVKGPFTSGNGAGDAICGKDFSLGPFEPGQYTLRLSAGSTFDDEARREGYATFTIGDKNVEVAASLQKGLDVDGKFVLAEGVPKASVRGATLMLGIALAYSPPGRAAEDGAFRIVNIVPAEYRISTTGLPAGLYVKEIRYNGSRVESTVTLNGSALAQQIVVELADRPAAVTGVVKQGDNPADGAWVVLEKWPSQTGNYWNRRPVAADENGKFQFTGLAPGEYRVFAVAREDRMRLEEPGAWERFVSAGRKITLDAGGFQNLTLAPAGPGR